MIDDFEFPTSESRQIALQLGIISIEWAGIDSQLAFAISVYLGIKPEYAYLPADVMNLSQKCTMLKALVFMKEDKKLYNRIANGIDFINNTIRPKRNRYIHDSYRFFDGSTTRITLKTAIKNVQSYQKELFTKIEQNISSDELSIFNDELKSCGMFVVSIPLRFIMNKGTDKNLVNAAHQAFDEYYGQLQEVMARYKSTAKAS